jgi:hypothetical protein
VEEEAALEQHEAGAAEEAAEPAAEAGPARRSVEEVVEASGPPLAERALAT